MSTDAHGNPLPPQTASTVTSVWGGAITARVTPIYPTIAARNIGEQTPIEGQLVYVADINQLQVYTGTSWVEIARLGDVLRLTGGTVTGQIQAVTDRGMSFVVVDSAPINNDKNAGIGLSAGDPAHTAQIRSFRGADATRLGISLVTLNGAGIHVDAMRLDPDGTFLVRNASGDLAPLPSAGAIAAATVQTTANAITSVDAHLLWQIIECDFPNQPITVEIHVEVVANVSGRLFCRAGIGWVPRGSVVGFVSPSTTWGNVSTRTTWIENTFSDAAGNVAISAHISGTRRNLGIQLAYKVTPQ